MNARKHIEALLDAAAELAVEEVERLARDVMRKHKRCASFCMAMGTACFYDKHGTPIDDETKYLKAFDDFVNEFDRELHITGAPMKIVGADGIKQSDW